MTYQTEIEGAIANVATQQFLASPTYQVVRQQILTASGMTLEEIDILLVGIVDSGVTIQDALKCLIQIIVVKNG